MALPIQALILDSPTGETVDLSNPTRPIFTWNPVNYATTYRIVISRDSSFSGFSENLGSSTCDSTCVTAKVSGTSYIPTAIEFTPQLNVTYYYKLRAGSDTVGYEHSAWSPIYSFKAQNQEPVAVCPIGYVPNHPLKTWKEWVAFFNQIATNNIACIGKRYTTVITSPKEEQTVSLRKLVFRWKEPVGIKPSKYRFVLSKNDRFTGYNELTKKCDDTCVTTEVFGNSLSVATKKKAKGLRKYRSSAEEAMDNAIYGQINSFLQSSSSTDNLNVKVQPIFYTPNVSVYAPYSNVRTFNLYCDKSKACDTPTLTAPADNEYLLSKQVSFSWYINTPYANSPDNYRIIVSTDKNIRKFDEANWQCTYPTCITKTTPNKTIDIDISTLPLSENYYWRVRANYPPKDANSASVVSGWSDTFTITTKLGTCEVLACYPEEVEVDYAAIEDMKREWSDSEIEYFFNNSDYFIEGGSFYNGVILVLDAADLAGDIGAVYAVYQSAGTLGTVAGSIEISKKLAVKSLKKDIKKKIYKLLAKRGLLGRNKAGKVTQYLKYTYKNIRENLVRYTGKNPKDSQAHHLLPDHFKEKFNKALGENEHNNPIYASWVKIGKHQADRVAYDKEWEVFFDKTPFPDKKDVLELAKELAFKYKYETNF